MFPCKSHIRLICTHALGTLRTKMQNQTTTRLLPVSAGCTGFENCLRNDLPTQKPWLWINFDINHQIVSIAHAQAKKAATQTVAIIAEPKNQDAISFK